MTLNNLKLVKLENLVRTEVNLTNFSDWKRTGTIYTEDNLSFAFLYFEFSGQVLCYLPLFRREINLIGKNTYYFDINKSTILKYSKESEDLDFTNNGIFVKYNLFKEYLEKVKGQ